MGRKAIDLTGTRVGKLVVLELYGSDHGHKTWLCQCDCGRKSVVRASYLAKKKVCSCGECERKNVKAEVSYSDSGAASLIRLKPEEDPFQNLANAIVTVAADDYRRALAKNDMFEQRSIEQFFGSEWYTMLTNVSGDLLVGLLRKEHKENPERIYI